MFTAAGKSAAVSAANYIEDVFSTYLYTGNGKAQSINNGISIGAAVGGGAFFNGSTDFLSLSPISLSGDFTIEGWVWVRNTASNPAAVGDLTGVNKQALRYLSGNHYYNNSGGGAVQGTITFTPNQWVYLAVSRVGGTTRIFTNGVLDGSVADSGAFSIRNIGCIANSTNMLSGYISNLRVLNGTGLYTSTFTVPTAPLTAITNTVLLICQSPSPFTDNAPIPNTLTQNGSPVALVNGGPFTSSTPGSGGMVWIKSRSAATDNALYDTARGATFDLVSNTTAAQTTQVDGLVSFNQNGFNIGELAKLNNNAATYVSWTFREQPKFFDVVTYTGNGVSGRTVAHNLGSVPGCIIVKCTSAIDNWNVYHRSLGNTQRLNLNLTQEALTDPNAWNNTTPTSLVFTVGNNSAVNANGATYVAYLFAHDAGGFGASGSDNVITCGSVVGSGTTSVTLGYEPQWILMKNRTSAQDWWLVDNMRGLPAPSANARLLIPNKTDAEAALSVNINSTGFTTAAFSSGETYIYIAIRRGPMKTPTSGTTVYSPVARTGTGAAASISSVPFPPDWVMFGPRSIADNKYEIDRLRGASEGLITNSTSAGIALGSLLTLNMNGISFSDGNSAWNQNAATYVNWFFGRAPGFFDVVCYTGTGSNTTFTHNLNVVPEMMIVKRRDAAGGWRVYVTAVGNTGGLRLNSTDSTITSSTFWNNTTPTASVFTVGTNADVNASGGTYVNYLFATCPGVSKVGSYTGTGALQTVNCGFASGARFVLIKRTDSTGDWWVYDSTRGITSGNDPYLFLNDTAAEVTNTNYVDTTSVGFQVTAAAPAGLNANGGTYIFLAIA